ncbi:MAG TPA: ATP-binding protein [Candidatus Binatia bacterium]|nr:ATP-binding protein [Candidatus Binatia bacterium]
MAGAVLSLLGRALGLERAALLIETGPGEALVTVATLGRVRLKTVLPDAAPGDGPWSAVQRLHAGGRDTGLLLLARAGGAPLSAGDRSLVRRLLDGASVFLEQHQLRDDLLHARELLARADRLSALGTLAAGVAHEIRNPLVSVRTFIQLLPERLADEEFRTSFRNLALGEIERICALINDLLAFSRPSPAQLEPSDLNELTQQTIRLLDAEGRKRDVLIGAQLEDTLPLVVADEARVKQVLMNVVLNAIQAAPSHSTVDVRSHFEEGPQGRWSVIEVSDVGPGIPAEQVEQIFDPFFTTKDTGSGLGLFIAHRIMTDHGGAILTRARPGGGTVFSILFPAAAEQQDAAG